MLFKVRVQPHRKRHVGERRQSQYGDIPAFRSDARHLGGSIARRGQDFGRGEACVPQPIVAMYPGCIHGGAQKGIGRADVYGDMALAGCLQNFEGVDGALIQGDVAVGDGDGLDIKLRVGQHPKQRCRVIHTGIGVDDDGASLVFVHDVSPFPFHGRNAFISSTHR